MKDQGCEEVRPGRYIFGGLPARVEHGRGKYEGRLVVVVFNGTTKPLSDNNDELYGQYVADPATGAVLEGLFFNPQGLRRISP